MSKTIAIQGSRGSFHELAAKKYFGKQGRNIVFCQNFLDVFEALDSGQANYALVAIVNNRYGDINHVYDILIGNLLTDRIDKYWISGEIFMPIEHCLLGLPGTKLDDIREVHSQAPALVQSFSFIQSELKNAVVVEEADTAMSASLVNAWQDPTKAAIASKQAAKIYGLKMLKKGIQNDKNNLTRFIIIEPRKPIEIKHANRTSILIRTSHKTGDLAKAIGLFSRDSINISYFQSVPIPNRPFEYRFYIDIDIGSSDPKFKKVLKGLTDLGYEHYILGSYKRASIPRVRR
jgi:chorismate mutase/prephenate dehydratase